MPQLGYQQPDPQAESGTAPAKDINKATLPAVNLRVLETQSLAALDSQDCLQREAITYTPDPKAQAGGWMKVGENGPTFHISGTAADGKYIPPDGYIKNGRAYGSALNAPKVYFQEPAELIFVLDLLPVPGKTNRFQRPGYGGEYSIQREIDGSLSVFHSGGKHNSNGTTHTMPPQTLVHGIWNLDRSTSSNPLLPERSAQRTTNIAEANRVLKTVLDRTEPSGNNATAIGTDTTAGGSGFYSTTSSYTHHAAPGKPATWEHHPELAVSDLQTTVPVGSRPQDIAARRDAAPPVRVQRNSADGSSETAYGFSRAVGPQQGVLCVSERDPSTPPAVLATLRAATNPDNTLASHVWHKVTVPGLNNGQPVRSMVRSDGSVLVEPTANATEFQLHVPSFQPSAASGLPWEVRMMRRGDRSVAEPDFVETDASRDKRRPPAPTAASTAPPPVAKATVPKDTVAKATVLAPAIDRTLIRTAAEQFARKKSTPGLHATTEFSLPEDSAQRNALVSPFSFTAAKPATLYFFSNGDQTWYVFPRRFLDRTTKTNLSGVLMLSDTELEAISDANTRKVVSAAYAQAKPGGKVERWVPVPDTAAEVSLRADGSFAFRNTSSPSRGHIYRPIVEGSKISWSPVPATADREGRFQPVPKK